MNLAKLALLAGLLATGVDAWGQQRAAPPDAAAQIRALRQQVTTLRRQLSLARNDLAAQNGAHQTLQAQFAALQRQVDSLATDVRALRANSILDLNGYLTLDVSSGRPTALFRGVNVQIVNGSGDTQTANGLGNLIVGYNRPSAGSFVCSLGIFAAESECTGSGGVWARSHKSGSHNIVAGDFNSYSSWGGLVLGVENAIAAPFATVLNGARNRAGGNFASVSGGSYNAAGGIYGSVTGGFGNIASGAFATIGGGSQRTVAGSHDWAAGTLFQEQ
jgi:hypothetical protein